MHGTEGKERRGESTSCRTAGSQINSDHDFKHLSTESKAPRISIIVPCYNASEFVERTIRSIIDQGYPNFECIVMDGGSTDGTLDILKKYESKINWKSERDKGQSDAINKGLRLATGDIIAYLNADDVYEKDCFRKVTDFFEKNPDIMWVHGRCKIINSGDVEIGKLITWFKSFCQRRYSYNRLLILDFIPQPAVFWRRQLVNKIGIFDTSEHLGMEYDYWLRAGAKYRPGFIDENLASFRIHLRSKSIVNSSRKPQEALDIAKRYTSSRITIMLHYLVCLGIILTYSFLNLTHWFRKVR